MKVLALDTSTDILSIALLENETVIGEHVTNIKKDHSRRLMPAIVSLMEEVNIKPEELDEIIVGAGPGSYTGVRIGLTTAKSLAWALSIPVVGVSSLQVLTYNGQFFDGLICPFFDARRKNVFAGLYEWDMGESKQNKADIHLSMNDLLTKLAQLKRDVLFLSPHISQYKHIIMDKLGENAIIPDKPFHIIKPGFLRLARIGKNEGNVHHLSPNYLRLAEAEANWLKTQKGD